LYTFLISLMCVLYAPFILLDSVILITDSINYKAPYYTVFSRHLLLSPS
jgi:hypothetical protein